MVLFKGTLGFHCDLKHVLYSAVFTSRELYLRLTALAESWSKIKLSTRNSLNGADFAIFRAFLMFSTFSLNCLKQMPSGASSDAALVQQRAGDTWVIL